MPRTLWRLHVIAAVFLALQACAPGGPRGDDPIGLDSLVSSQSGSPEPTSTTEPSEDPSRPGFLRLSHGSGLFDISYPSRCIDSNPRRLQRDEPQNSFGCTTYDSDLASITFKPADIKLHVGATELSADSKGDTRAESLEVDGMRGFMRIYRPEDTDWVWADYGQRLIMRAYLQLKTPVPWGEGNEHLLRSINIDLWAGEDTPEMRDLFMDIVRSLEVHQ